MQLQEVKYVAIFLLIGGLIYLISSGFFPPEKIDSVQKVQALSSTLTRCDDHDSSRWHPAVKKDGGETIICAYEHEHGDSPPGWVHEAGFHPGFDHTSNFHGNTSIIENTLKHPGMKGFAGSLVAGAGKVDFYARIHLMSNPMDRSARYHSYELFLKDPSGGVSHFQGWLDTGDPVKDRIPYQDKSVGELGVDPGRRPLVWASSKHACEIDQIWCRELWYMTSSDWGPDITWGVNESTTLFQMGEKYDENVSNWSKTGSLGGNRAIAITIKPTLRGKIWATQYGEIVSGPDDPKCHKNICLENYVAETLPEIPELNNSVIKEYDTTGVKLPN